MGAGKRKRKEDNASQGSILVAEDKNDVSFSEPTKQKKQKASSWLENFLSQKRDLVVPIPPDCELADDTYIREFNLQFVRSKEEKEKAEKEVKEGDSSDDEEGKFQSVEIAVVSREDRDDIIEVEDEPQINGKVKLSNLPYRITEKDVTDTGLAYGIVIVSVEFDMDKRTSLPAGSASVLLAIGVEEDEAIRALHGKDCGGRPLRVQAVGVKKSRSSGGRTDRYFLGGDIKDFKCNNCGKVGHKAAECQASSVNPCHLCAGRDHDSGDCPNITCFRCGEFGHHSRSCNNARRYSKAFICTLCASSTHDSRHCMQPPDKAMARVEDRSTRCMRCNQLGHALCKGKIAGTKEEIKGIFCPNCGENDHHVDYPKPPGPGSRAHSILPPFNPCQAPKYDAYIKFPQLLRNIGYSGSSGGGGGGKTEYYQSLVRSAGNSELAMSWFPQLCRISGSNGGDRGNGSSSGNAGSGGGGYGGSGGNVGSGGGMRDELRRSTIGGVSDGRRGFSHGNNGNNGNTGNNDSNRFMGVGNYSERRESYAVSSGVTFKDKNCGRLSTGSSSSSSSSRPKDTDNRHQHFSGQGRSFSYDYEEMEEMKYNKRDSMGHSGGRVGKWKADTAFLEKRVVVNNRSHNNSRSVVRVSGRLLVK